MDYQPNLARERNMQMHLYAVVCQMTKRQAVEYLIERNSMLTLHLDQLREALASAKVELPSIIEAVRSTVQEALAEFMPPTQSGACIEAMRLPYSKNYVVKYEGEDELTAYLSGDDVKGGDWNADIENAMRFKTYENALEAARKIEKVTPGMKLTAESVGGPEFNPSDTPTVVVKPPADEPRFLIERKMDEEITLFYKGRTNVGGGICWTSERDRAAPFSEHANAVAVVAKLSLRFAGVSVQPFKA